MCRSSERIESSGYRLFEYCNGFCVFEKTVTLLSVCYEMFRKGQYSEGYFSYKEDGFGKVCEKEQDVVREIKQITENGMTMPNLYQQRVDEFFSYRDKNNCERNYKAICKL